ncbi:MAG: hypothetical protein ACPIOQ_33680 [Promethearchaeia archaeon]
MEGESLPEGWSKHWSNSWKKHYWFNSKTGKQSWEHPGAGAAAATSAAGDKRKAQDPPVPAEEAVSKAPRPANGGAAGGPAPVAGGDGSSVQLPCPTKPAPAASGLLGSILGSIASSAKAPTAQQLEARKKKKDAEDARMSEVRAERENYKQWAAFQIDAFLEEGKPFFEFPPSDSVHRIIAKDEAEERGCVAFSHGEKEDEKRVFVFPKGQGPNHLETRYLQMGGTVVDLVQRRARGDTFKEYNTAFSLNDAKVVTKVRAKDREDHEDEVLESRTVHDRTLSIRKD